MNPHHQYRRITDPRQPCKRCGRPRYQQASGKWRCRVCHNRRPEKDSDYEESTCPCGATFRRLIYRGARRCEKCQNNRSRLPSRDPTQAEIRERAEECRHKWTERDWYHRAGLPYQPYEIEQHASEYLLPGGMTERDVFNF